jgi:DNA-binding phage protein
MEWPSALAGFALGLLSSYLILRVQRSWQRKDDAIYTEKVINSLIVEISEGLDRAKYMASLADQRGASFGRIYTALWESTSQRLAATLSDAETLALLHRLYYRFDLINFNCDAGRPESGGAFAKQYLGEIEGNLAKLKARLKVG